MAKKITKKIDPATKERLNLLESESKRIKSHMDNWLERNPEVKEMLWGGEFWSDGYFVNSVSKIGNETSISKYVRDQGLEKEYVILHSSKQLAILF